MLTFYALMGSFFWFDTIRLGMVLVYIKESQVNIMVFLSLKISFVLAILQYANVHI